MAQPVNCIADESGAPFLALLQENGLLDAALPADETFSRLIARAREALLSAARPDTVSLSEAQSLAEAALGCLHRTEGLTDGKTAALALNYIAAIALARAMTDPAVSGEASLRAERLLDLLRAAGLREIEKDHQEAFAVLGELARTSSRLAGQRRSAAVPIRERVDGILAAKLVPGSVTMERHLEQIYAPVQDRLRLLISIALAKESARSLIHGSIAEPVKEDLPGRFLSGGEAMDLARMRGSYAAIFPDSLSPDDTVPKLRDGAQERLLVLRSTLAHRGLPEDTAKGFCMGSRKQPDCLSYEGALFSDGGAYPDLPGLDALVPLRAIDLELQGVASEVLLPFVDRFGTEPPQGTQEELQKVMGFLSDLAGGAGAMRPSRLDAYIQSADGKTPLRPDLFETESTRTVVVDLCDTPPSRADGPPHFGAGAEDIAKALYTAETFPNLSATSPDGTLALTCLRLRSIADEIVKGDR
ncbi:MAG: hypothetical protein INF92_13625 [Rhodobacter sp.]|nr:hypothetical protein [Rhodobacter sp.]